jgi:Cu(I)/Ag(I) efflux system membrane fusion protein
LKIKLFQISVLLVSASFNVHSQESEYSHSMGHSNYNNIIENKKIGSEIKFICPMHPEIIQNHEGTCPICGMDLVEKKENNRSDVFIDSGLQQNINLKYSESKMMLIKPEIKSYGRIKYNEDTIYKYHSRFKGWVEKSYIEDEGQYIEKDEKIFEIYSDELIIAQQDYILAKNLNDEKLIKAPKTKLKLLGVNEKVINEIDKNHTIFYTVPFYSLKSGFVDEFMIREGSYVEPNKELIKTVNTETLWLDGYAFEDDKNLISIGDKVIVKTLGSEEYESEIDYIYPELDEDTLALKFRVTIDNSNKSNNLKPNEISDIIVKTNKKIRGLFIPKDALIQTEYNNRVVVKNGEKFIVKEVVVGYKNDKYAQILKGLGYKEKVVTSGQFLIDSEASLSGSIIRIEDNDQ